MLAQGASAQVLRVVGEGTSVTKHVEAEEAFYAGLAANAGLNETVSFNPSDVIGVKPADALRLLRTGAFDIIATQIGQAARDDAFLEGIDLVGVATDVPSLRKSVDAFRAAFDARLQERFNAKVLTLWPFGPQVIFCKDPISGLADLKGHKVRVFTASMAELIKNLGGTAVTMPGSEVYTALQRGVVDCAITSATSGNSSKWPELTSYFFPLGLSGSVQGDLINLDTWNRFTPEQQAALTAEFKKLEDKMWDLASSLAQDAQDCNTGSPDCKEHTPYTMKLVPVTPEDIALVHELAVDVVLPMYKDDCTKVYPDCVPVWNETVGAAQGLAIK